MSEPAAGSWRVRVLALLLSVAAVLAFAEALQRVSDWRKAAGRAHRYDPYSIRGVTRTGAPLGVHGEKGRLSLELTPHMLFVNQPDQRLQGVRINGQGFRGGEWQLPRQPGVRRIVALGGSTAFGKASSSDDTTWAAELQRRLSREQPTEVLNAGIIGFDSTQERILLASRLLDYAPDLVLFFDGWNDFYNGGRVPEERALTHPHFLEVEQAILDGQQPLLGLLRLSAFYRGLERKLPAWRLALGIDSPPDRGYGRFRYDPRAAERYGRNLERMIRLARAYGAASLVATQPEIFQREGPTEFEQYKRDQLEEDGYADYARAHYDDYVDVAHRVAAAEGVPFVALGAIFDDIREDVFTDLVHLTDRGQARVAQALAGPVERALDAAADASDAPQITPRSRRDATSSQE